MSIFRGMTPSMCPEVVLNLQPVQIELLCVDLSSFSFTPCKHTPISVCQSSQHSWIRITTCFSNYCKKTNVGPIDISVGRGTCCQAQWHDVNIIASHAGKLEPTAAHGVLTSTYMPEHMWTSHHVLKINKVVLIVLKVSKDTMFGYYTSHDHFPLAHGSYPYTQWNI